MTSVPIIETRAARAEFDDHRFRGFSLYGELAGSETMTGMTALALTGRRLSTLDRAILDDLTVVVTVAEPRIWPLRLARVVASHGGALAGLAASTAAMEFARIGPYSVRPAATWLKRLRLVLGDAPDDEAIAAAVDHRLQTGRRLPGFGVPARETDERVSALRRCLKQRKVDDRPYWRLLERVAMVVNRRHGIAVNISGAFAAVGLDLGFAPEHLGVLATMALQPALLVNAFEGSQQRAPSLARLPDACVEYVGPPPRRSARALRE